MTASIHLLLPSVSGNAISSFVLRNHEKAALLFYLHTVFNFTTKTAEL